MMLNKYYQYQRWKEEARNFTGGLQIGCLVYLIGIPLTLIVLIVLAVFQILSLAVLMIYGEYISQMEPLFNQLVVKLLFYPATFDSVHNLFVDRPFLNLFVLLIMVVFLSLAFVLLKRKWIKA